EAPRRPAEPSVLEPGFRPTYRAAKHEAEWLYQSLATFFDQELITDIEAQVKGGKEATVYRCTAHPSVGLPWLAAKVYRPRRFRALRKDAIYKQGRPLLNSMGGEMKKTDKRMARAIDARTSTGLQAQHTSWLMYEFTTMEHL